MPESPVSDLRQVLADIVETAASPASLVKLAAAARSGVEWMSGENSRLSEAWEQGRRIGMTGWNYRAPNPYRREGRHSTEKVGSAFDEHPDPNCTTEHRVNDHHVYVHFTASDGIGSFRAPTPAEVAEAAVSALRSARLLLPADTRIEYAYLDRRCDLVPHVPGPGEPHIASTHQRIVGPWLPVEETETK